MTGYAIVETTEDGKTCVAAASKIWIKNNILYWPKTSIFNRKNPTEPDLNEWKQYPFVLIKDCIDSYDTAISAEILYSQYQNSEAEQEALRIKKLKRLHPVKTHANGHEIDVNCQLIEAMDATTSQSAHPNVLPLEIPSSNIRKIAAKTNKEEKKRLQEKSSSSSVRNTSASKEKKKKHRTTNSSVKTSTNAASTIPSHPSITQSILTTFNGDQSFPPIQPHFDSTQTHVPEVAEFSSSAVENFDVEHFEEKSFHPIFASDNFFGTNSTEVFVPSKNATSNVTHTHQEQDSFSWQINDNFADLTNEILVLPLTLQSLVQTPQQNATLKLHSTPHYRTTNIEILITKNLIKIFSNFSKSLACSIPESIYSGNYTLVAIRDIRLSCRFQVTAAKSELHKDHSSTYCFSLLSLYRPVEAKFSLVMPKRDPKSTADLEEEYEEKKSFNRTLMTVIAPTSATQLTALEN
ncbi:hypothetical protein Bhyg_03225 [Pseudolycoriella hygida]|uniref:Uncharacterized protein n=1 Tax=Pseudolycoriella hygida TaxID=35572 RepID=A0A9Q0NCY9_9DIPT|nr:hypothetical protein Bhyg_03225 [Pseudolycoriella hygida]